MMNIAGAGGVLGAAVHRAVIHGRGVSVPVHGGSLSTGGALVIALLIAGAVAIGIVGWRFDRRGTRVATDRVVTDAGQHVDEWDVRKRPRKPAAAAPLSRGDVGVVHRRRPDGSRDDRDPMV